jgi:hypothetical protein
MPLFPVDVVTRARQLRRAHEEARGPGRQRSDPRAPDDALTRAQNPLCAREPRGSAADKCGVALRGAGAARGRRDSTTVGTRRGELCRVGHVLSLDRRGRGRPAQVSQASLPLEVKSPVRFSKRGDVSRRPRSHSRSTYRATKLRETRRTETTSSRLNKPHRPQRITIRRYRTQEVARSSPASSIAGRRFVRSCELVRKLP